MAGKKLPAAVKAARELEKRARAVLDNYEKNPNGVRYANAVDALRVEALSAGSI